MIGTKTRAPRRRVLDHAYPVVRLETIRGHARSVTVLRNLLECGHTLAPRKLSVRRRRRCWKCQRGMRPDIAAPRKMGGIR